MRRSVAPAFLLLQVSQRGALCEGGHNWVSLLPKFQLDVSWGHPRLSLTIARRTLASVLLD